MKQRFAFPGPRDGRPDLLFIAGEHSGDQHAALIAREVRQRHPSWSMAAVGGPALSREGVQVFHDLTRDSVVGLVEVLKHYGMFKRLFNALLEWVRTHQPKVVVLVDYPGFNLRFAEALQKEGISRKGGGSVAVYQYVSPQIWAWKAKRRFKMARILDGLGTIFPFEPDCYSDTDLPVAFVGHPFARGDYRNPVSYDPDGPVLVLPGSRKQAVSRIFPVMVEAVRQYRVAGGKRPCVCLYPGEDIRFILEHVLGRAEIETSWISLRSVETATDASVVLTSSGTMSLNCALAGVPGAIVYQAHPVTAWLGKWLIKVEWLGIANLVLGRSLYPEHLQQAADPVVLARLILSVLDDAQAARPFQEGAVEIQSKLCAPEETDVVSEIESLIKAG